MPVGLHERESRLQHLAELSIVSAQLIRDIQRHIAAPAFSGIKSDDADGVVVIARHQIADKRVAVSLMLIGFSPSTAEPAAEVIQHEVSCSGPWGAMDGEVRITKLPETPGTRSQIYDI